MLLPSAAHAQRGKKPPTPPPPTAPAGGGATGAAGGEIELDEPKKPDEAPAGGVPTPPAGGDTGTGGGGICEIDPSACPKQSDLKTLSNRNVNADVYAVQQVFFLRRGRFEINPYWSFSLNDQFVGHLGPGLSVNYYLTNVLAIGLSGTYYQPFNSDSDFNFQTRRATRVAVPLTEYSWSAALNFTYVPVYGKFAGFGSFIFSYDLYATGGVGAISTRPIPVIDPDNRKFDFDPKVCFNLGIGLRVFVTRWLAITGEIRDYIYPEKLESLTIANGPIGQPSDPNSPSNPKTWVQDGVDITNNFQANVGLSFFLPFSFEYRLPK